MHEMDRRNAQRKRKRRTKANHIDDYEKAVWQSNPDNRWDDYDYFVDDLDFTD